MTNKLIGKSLTKNKGAFLLPLLLVFLLSSCGILKNVGVEKRLYRPGYHIFTNSSKAVAIKNITSDEDKKNASVEHTVSTEIQKTETVADAKKNSLPLFDTHLKKVKALVSGKGKRVTSTVKDIGMSPIHKAKTIIKSQKTIDDKATSQDTGGKSYSLSTVVFVIGAIIILWGIAVFFAHSFPMMSADIALTLTIIVALTLIILWGIIILAIKDWANGTNDINNSK